MIKAIVFDFDGVLADSEPLHLRAYQEVLSTFGITFTRDEYYTNYLGYDDEGVFHGVGSDTGYALEARRIQALIEEKTGVFDARWRKTSGVGDILYPGAAACIELMASRYPLGIASGALRHEIEAILRGAVWISTSGSSSRPATRRKASRHRIRTDAPRSFTASRRPSASRSKTRAGASNPRNPPASPASVSPPPMPANICLAPTRSSSRSTSSRLT